MFGGMNPAINAHDLLGAPDPHIVGESCRVVRKTGSPAGSRKRRHPLAASSPVQVYAQLRLPSADRPAGRHENLGNSRIPGEYFAETLFHGNSEFQIGTAALKQQNSGRRQDTIAEGAEPDNGHSRGRR